jgi:hypothetical protein
MVIHAENNTSAGYRAKVLLAGANGMYLFQGDDLSTPVSGYTIYPLPGSVGCSAPRTMAWTPRGTMWLGIDKQVYLLPFDSATPVPVGDKITDEQGEVGGLEGIPSGQISKASAVYHDGYYKLSITRSGGSNNTDQWWLDVTAMQRDADGVFPWYGPMKGQSIGPQITLNGPNDIGEHYGGEATAKGYVYELSQKDVFTDVNPSDGSSRDFEHKWVTLYNALGETPFRKAVHEGEIEVKAIEQTINITYRDINETLKTGTTISLDNSGFKWGQLLWGSGDTWNSDRPGRKMIDITPSIYPRRMSVLLSGSSSNDFVILALRFKSLEQSKDFD